MKKNANQKIIDDLYKQAALEIIEERGDMCQSCGAASGYRSMSHIISRKRCKEIGRIDLIYSKDNIIIECHEPPCSFPSKCHNLWELRQLHKIMDQPTFDYKMNFISENDPQQFQILLRKLNNV